MKQSHIFYKKYNLIFIFGTEESVRLTLITLSTCGSNFAVSGAADPIIISLEERRLMASSASLCQKMGE